MSSKTTIDHHTILRWAEERGGRPSRVRETESEDDSGILRIDFPGYGGENSLEEISWDEFFAKFEESKLALLYQEVAGEKQTSNFNKPVSRDLS